MTRLPPEPRSESYSASDRLIDAVIGVVLWGGLTLLATYLHHVASAGVTR